MASKPKGSKRPKILNDLGTLLTTPEGRAILWRQLENAGIFRSSFDMNPLLMAFREGQRNEGLMLLADMQAASIDNFFIMWRENYDGIQHPDTSGQRNNDTSGDGDKAPGADYTTDIERRRDEQDT